VLSTALFFCACNRSKQESPIVVHVLRDANGSSATRINHALLVFNGTRFTRTGHPITIATLERRDYPDTVKVFADQCCDLIVLDSPGDVLLDPKLRPELAQARNLCSGRQVYPAFVPSWIIGEQREAAQMFLDFLTSH